MLSLCPLVSVVIPVYNGADLIEQAIQSVVAQTYQPIEILIVDDGSEDRDALQEVAARYPSVRLIRQEHSGVAAALNRGLREMSGAFFCWLSHDDLFHPHKVAHEVRCCVEAGSKVVVFSDYCYIDTDGNVLAFQHIPRGRAELAGVLLLQNTWIHGCAMLIPKHCLEAVGAFDERLQTTQDYDLFFRLAERYGFRHLTESVTAVRLHPRQSTNTMKTAVLTEQDALYCGAMARISSAAVTRFSGEPPARFYAYLYRRFSLGLLPQSATAARRRAWVESKSAWDKFLILGSLLLVNGWTTRLLRIAVLRRAAMLQSRQRRLAPATWRNLLAETLDAGFSHPKPLGGI